MTDLISRADAMGAVQDHFNANGFKGYDDGQKMMDRIKALPSADTVSREQYQSVVDTVANLTEEMSSMVKVVRCKDCKYSGVYGKTTQWLACENVMEGQATDPDGYCYLGERREP